MKRLLPITLTLLSLSLVGCGEESDSSPADGRDFDAEGYAAPGPYTGRVIDGYLRNARVWLDMDGDGQYTAGPMTIQDEADNDILLPNGEPTALTGEDGVFSLDVSELQQDPLVAPDLNPLDYPLIALVLPGRTIEQTPGGDVVLNEAYMLTASPGTRNVTPLTTLLRQRAVNGLQEFLVGSSDLAQALGNVNLVSDYVRSGDHRAHAYAQAFARFLASQFPDAYEDLLRTGDGTERFLSRDAVRLMGISFASNVLTVVEAVDDAAGGDYETVDIQSLVLPEVEIELEDYLVIDRQTVRARATGGGLPTSLSSLDVLAELDFDYAEDGRLTAITANGCMRPTLKEIARLINADGKISDTGTQWIPTISLNQQSGTFYDEEGPDERISFDWEAQTAAFETTTSCHTGLAASSELGGPAAVSYSWTLSGGRLETLTATSASLTEVFTPDYANNNRVFFGYTREENSVDEEVVGLGAIQSCFGSIIEEDLEEDQVVSAIQPFTMAGAIAQPAGFTDLELELDTRDDFFRPLRYGFLDERIGEVSADGFEWSFFYPAPQLSTFEADQPDLPNAAYLSRFIGDRNCGRDFGNKPRTIFAEVAYSYQNLSEYLAGQLD